MKILYLALINFLFFSFIIEAQERTVGLISYDDEKAFPGYNFIYPHNQSNVYLLDNCGQICHEWKLNQSRLPGNSAYLQEDGSIILCSRNKSNAGEKIWAGGGGAFVEAFDWEGNLLWSFEQNDSLKRLHHDIEVMPNGNVLMISWELKRYEECIEAGRDPENLFQNKLWPDYVLEYDPILDSVVWEWHVWDHLIQDFDPSKSNFGNISENSGLVNINYETNLGNPDWNHMNSIDYNASLDQILLSVPNFDEIWIIDHSTTSEEAKTNTGGKSGRGGDLLFRWGNPASYNSGDSTGQKLFFQHNAHWVDDSNLSQDSLYNSILLFNNRIGADFSAANVIEPILEEGNSNYKMSQNTFLPSSYSNTIVHPIKEKLYSSGLSSVQYLENGNFLLLAGRVGHAYEITSSNEIVWDYVLPFKKGESVEQGTELELSDNNLFRIKRFPVDFIGFQGRDLSPGGQFVLNEVEDICDKIVSTEETLNHSSFSFFPNPTSSVLNIDLKTSKKMKISILDAVGRVVLISSISQDSNVLNISHLSSGLYFIKTENGGIGKFLKTD